MGVPQVFRDRRREMAAADGRAYYRHAVVKDHLLDTLPNASQSFQVLDTFCNRMAYK